MENVIGRVIKSYELRERIGEGGFGAVYLAHQPSVSRDVAIKIIYPVFANHPNFIRRFETEAQLVAGLEHPYIVPLYDYWREPDGAYLVMRWLRGGALRRSIEQDGAWALDSVTQLLGQVSAALTLAHRYGVVHRDLKPENILLDEEGNAYLADFGIAQILSSAKGTEDEFVTMGSPAYAAPEQMAGKPTTPQADIYSLGVITYELLTGKHPFPELESMSLTQLTSDRVYEPLPPLFKANPDLPLALDPVVQRATAMNPSERYPDPLSFARAFRQALSSRQTFTAGDAAARDPRRETATFALLDVLPNPYKGLRAFQESDAANFYGRDSLVQILINRLRENVPNSRFLGVVGPSGSGKSSVVKAGMIPILKEDGIPDSKRWFFVEIVPGPQPYDELQAALISIAVNPPDDLGERIRRDRRGLLDVLNQILPPDPRTELFLFIDQFEEIFTLVSSEDEAAQFLSLLYTAVTDPTSRLRLVITLRADFYDRPLLYPNMSELMRERTEVVVPLSPDELEQAIVGPIQQIGVMPEPGLVSAIINEVNEQPGALPLLQYLLSELFERRKGNIMTLDTYRVIGGVKGALARRADELYASFTPPQQESTRQLFLRLITLGEGTEDTRRRALLSEVTSMSDQSSEMQYVIDTLGKARLLTFDRDPITRGPTVEVTHEAIIRQWQRLRGWLDESRADVRLQRGLASLTNEWVSANRDISFLLRGSRLEQYEKWAEVTNLALTLEEREFLRASIAERQLRQTQEIERQEREELLERRSRNRLRSLVGVMAFALIIGAGLLALSVSQSQLAQQERDRAEAARATSDANSALSLSLALEASARQAASDDNSDLALVLALEANNMTGIPPVQAQRALAEVAFAPGTRDILTGHGAWVTGADFSPDGSRLVSSSTDGTARLWNVSTGEQLREFVGHRGDVQATAYSPDGRTVASGSIDYDAIIWDVETGEPLVRLEGHTEPIRSVGYSPDGTTLLTSSSDRTLILWDVATGTALRRYEGHTTSVYTEAFSPDGQEFVSGAGDGTLIIWNVASGQPRLSLTGGHATTVNDAAYSPDGTQIVSASADGRMVLWDSATGQIVRTMGTTASSVTSVAFHPTRRLVMSSTADSIVHLWNVDTGEEVDRLRGHRDSVLTVAISRDGMTAVSGSKDTSMRVWNIGDPRVARTFAGHTERISEIAFASDGASFYTASADSSIRQWATVTGAETGAFVPPDVGPLQSVDIDAASRSAIIGLRDGAVQLWSLNSNSLVSFIGTHPAQINALAYNAAHNRVLVGDRDGGLILWDVDNASALHQLAGHEGSIFSTAISADGRIGISGGQGGIVKLWDLTTGEEVHSLIGHNESVFAVAINTDGTLALSGSLDGDIILWNATAGTERARFVGHSEQIWSLNFSPNGQLAVSGSQDGSLILWDIGSGSELQRFSGTDSPVFKVAFSPDGQYVVSGHQSGVLRTWHIYTLDELRSWALDNRFLAELSCVEREVYRIQPLCDEATPPPASAWNTALAFRYN